MAHNLKKYITLSIIGASIVLSSAAYADIQRPYNPDIEDLKPKKPKPFVPKPQPPLMVPDSVYIFKCIEEELKGKPTHPATEEEASPEEGIKPGDPVVSDEDFRAAVEKCEAEAELIPFEENIQNFHDYSDNLIPEVTEDFDFGSF